MSRKQEKLTIVDAILTIFYLLYAIARVKFPHRWRGRPKAGVVLPMRLGAEMKKTRRAFVGQDNIANTISQARRMKELFHFDSTLYKL